MFTNEQINNYKVEMIVTVFKMLPKTHQRAIMGFLNLQERTAAGKGDGG